MVKSQNVYAHSGCYRWGLELTGLGGSISTPALWLKVSVTDTES
jgi:hypothetical protein